MSPVKVPESFEVPRFLTDGGRGEDFIKCWWMCQEIGVVGIPPSEVSHISFLFFIIEILESIRRMVADECSSTVKNMKVSERDSLDLLS